MQTILPEPSSGTGLLSVLALQHLTRKGFSGQEGGCLPALLTSRGLLQRLVRSGSRREAQGGGDRLVLGGWGEDVQKSG